MFPSTTRATVMAVTSMNLQQQSICCMLKRYMSTFVIPESTLGAIDNADLRLAIDLLHQGLSSKKRSGHDRLIRRLLQEFRYNDNNMTLSSHFAPDYRMEPIVLPNKRAVVVDPIQVSASGDLVQRTQQGASVAGTSMNRKVWSQSNVIVAMKHMNEDGSPKIVRKCHYPFSVPGVVDRIVTEFAVFDVSRTGNGQGRLTLVEIAPNMNVADIMAITEADFQVARDLREMDDGASRFWQ